RLLRAPPPCPGLGSPSARTCPRTSAWPPRLGVLAQAPDLRADPAGQTQTSRLRKPPPRTAAWQGAPGAPRRQKGVWRASVGWFCGAPGSLVGNGSPDRRGGAGGVRSVEAVVVLVAVATVVAAFAKRLRVPAPSLLVAAGLAVGMLPGAPVVHVPPAVVSLVVLPPLLYAASEELSWRDLRAVWGPGGRRGGGLGAAPAGPGPRRGRGGAPASGRV